MADSAKTISLHHHIVGGDLKMAANPEENWSPSDGSYCVIEIKTDKN